MRYYIPTDGGFTLLTETEYGWFPQDMQARKAPYNAKPLLAAGFPAFTLQFESKADRRFQVIHLPGDEFAILHHQGDDLRFGELKTRQGMLELAAQWEDRSKEAADTLRQMLTALSFYETAQPTGGLMTETSKHLRLLNDVVTFYAQKNEHVRFTGNSKKKEYQQLMKDLRDRLSRYSMSELLALAKREGIALS